MLATVLNFLREPVEFSVLGFTEAASVAIILYYIYAKTRTLAILGGIFSNYCYLNVNDNNEIIVRKVAKTATLNVIKKNTQKSRQGHGFSHGIGTRNMLQITPHAGRKPFTTSLIDWGIYFPYVAQAVRTRKFSYPQVLPAVQKDPILQRAVKQAAEQILRQQQQEQQQESHQIHSSLVSNHNNFTSSHLTNTVQKQKNDNYQDILYRQERRAYNLLKEMRSTLNNFLLAITSWLLYKLLPCFLTGVVTHTEQIEMLKTASQKAPGIPLIFLPLHRSHLDYIMVTFILTNNDIRSPLVAAGNNLQIPVFGGLLRGLGAFFIKRKIDPVVGKKDTLYRTILHLYLQHALKLGHNVEFFIEGGRTRTGKPCMPKGGILSVIVNAFMDRSIPDALLVPVSVNYERLVDGNFVREQKGEKKTPETFRKAISGIWKALNSNYGLMRIDFNEPYSIKELVQSYNKIAVEEGSSKVYKPSARILQHNQSTSSLYGTDVVCEEHRNLIDCISRQIVYDCATATSVMSTNALAFLLLTRYRAGTSCNELANALDELRNTLEGRKDLGFSGGSKDVIMYAADLLGETLIKCTPIAENDSILIQVNDSIESWIELAYYANTLTPHFALQSIVLTTFHNLLNKIPTMESNEESKDVQVEYSVSRKKLIETSIDNCDIYRYEYILHKPTETMEQLLEKTIDELFMQELIKITQPYCKTNDHSDALGAFIDVEYDEYNTNLSDEDEDSLNIGLEGSEVSLVQYTLEKQKFLCEVLAPFGYTYLCVTESLYHLYKNPMLESDFIQLIIQALIHNVKTEKYPYAESISTESIKNCLKVLEKWSVIEISNQSGLRLLALSTLYETSRDSLKNIIQRISQIVPSYSNIYFIN